MPRLVRNSKLDTRTARALLPQNDQPYWHHLSRGLTLGYRKAPRGNVWLAKLVKTGYRKQETLGPADDVLDADGVHVLSFEQAQRQAFAWKAKLEAPETDGQPSITVREALDLYEKDLRARNGDLNNVRRIRAHLADDLLDTPVAVLTRDQLRAWRDGLVKIPPRRRHAIPDRAAGPLRLSKPAVNRTCAALKAALNLVADDPKQRISSRHAWQDGLRPIEGADQSRNCILDDDVVRLIVENARNYIPEFGLFVEVTNETGARPSQVERLDVRDLQANRPDPRLMMPPSRKGGKRAAARMKPHYAVPIPVDLARRLSVIAKRRDPDEPLLSRPYIGKWLGGKRWDKDAYDDPFEETVRRSGLGDWEKLGYEAPVTLYALRHSSIVRQLKKGVAIRIVAANHNTSVGMIEKHYSRHITDHTDAITRAALLDTPETSPDNIVSIRAGAAP
jgi:hypothetical protein